LIKISKHSSFEITILLFFIQGEFTMTISQQLDRPYKHIVLRALVEYWLHSIAFFSLWFFFPNMGPLGVAGAALSSLFFTIAFLTVLMDKMKAGWSRLAQVSMLFAFFSLAMACLSVAMSVKFDKPYLRLGAIGLVTFLTMGVMARQFILFLQCLGNDDHLDE
jgi:hypothetical protein